ncbi:MAG: pilus assembly protein PilP [Wenzhouxiangellaceae bacterium]
MRKFLMPLVLASVVAGCSDSNQDLERWVQETLARPPDPIEPIPPIVQPEPFTYEAGNLRDPFMRPRPAQIVDSGVGSGPRPDPNRRREFLENFPLDALSMVGTIETPDAKFGLISDVEDTIHRVREGNYLGQNHGRILRITPVAIELMELVPDGSEGWMEREARIALREDQRG